LSISIYYSARREQPLSPAERANVDALVAKYTIEEQLAERERTGEGPNWESFCVYNSVGAEESGVVFEGATKLPDNSEKSLWLGVQHWCRLLSEIRRVLQDASWQVHIDDHSIVWDEERGEYDPSV
jgi:hypothetical protein